MEDLASQLIVALVSMAVDLVRGLISLVLDVFIGEFFNTYNLDFVTFVNNLTVTTANGSVGLGAMFYEICYILALVYLILVLSIFVLKSFGMVMGMQLPRGKLLPFTTMSLS